MYPKVGVTGSKVVLSEIHLPLLENPICMFGEEEVIAEFFPPSSLSCEVPPLHHGIIRRKVQVRISLNGLNFEDEEFLFEYIDLPVALRIVPSYGPSQGGNKVIVYGANFHRRNSIFYCKFDALPTLAFVIRSDKLLCNAPPGSIGPALVTVVDTITYEEKKDLLFKSGIVD